MRCAEVAQSKRILFLPLVEEEYPRPAGHRARERDKLLLAHRELGGPDVEMDAELAFQELLRRKPDNGDAREMLERVRRFMAPAGA